MRIPALLLLALSFMLPANDANAQTRCKDGTAATISGTIGNIQPFRPEPGVVMWDLTGDGKLSGNCPVDRVWGDGNIPAGCAKGKKFTATGKAIDADRFWMLQADRITCN
jgi:hypothetical protein